MTLPWGCGDADDTSLPDHIRGVLSSLQKKVIRLYTQIYQYQIGVVRQYSRHVVIRRLRDVGAIDGWQSMLADMTGLNALIEGDIQALMNHATLNTDANMFKVLASVSNMDGKLDSLLRRG